MSDLKSDNARMEEIKDIFDKSVEQKEIYMRATQEDVRLFLQNWKKLNNSVNQFDEFIYALNDSLNPNY
jgi:sRNA-binding regulator protein Hfq